MCPLQPSHLLVTSPSHPAALRHLGERPCCIASPSVRIISIATRAPPRQPIGDMIRLPQRSCDPRNQSSTPFPHQVCIVLDSSCSLDQRIAPAVLSGPYPFRAGSVSALAAWPSVLLVFPPRDRTSPNRSSAPIPSARRLHRLEGICINLFMRRASALPRLRCSGVSDCSSCRCRCISAAQLLPFLHIHSTGACRWSESPGIARLFRDDRLSARRLAPIHLVRSRHRCRSSMCQEDPSNRSLQSHPRTACHHEHGRSSAAESLRLFTPGSARRSRRRNNDSLCAAHAVLEPDACPGTAPPAAPRARKSVATYRIARAASGAAPQLAHLACADNQNLLPSSIQNRRARLHTDAIETRRPIPSVAPASRRKCAAAYPAVLDAPARAPRSTMLHLPRICASPTPSNRARRHAKHVTRLFVLIPNKCGSNRDRSTRSAGQNSADAAPNRVRTNSSRGAGRRIIASFTPVPSNARVVSGNALWQCSRSRSSRRSVCSDCDRISFQAKPVSEE